MDSAELFERGSFGRGCELYVVPFFNMGRFKQPGQEEEDTRKTRSFSRSSIHDTKRFVVVIAHSINQDR